MVIPPLFTPKVISTWENGSCYKGFCSSFKYVARAKTVDALKENIY